MLCDHILIFVFKKFLKILVVEIIKKKIKRIKPKQPPAFGQALDTIIYLNLILSGICVSSYERCLPAEPLYTYHECLKLSNKFYYLKCKKL